MGHEIFRSTLHNQLVTFCSAYILGGVSDPDGATCVVLSIYLALLEYSYRHLIAEDNSNFQLPKSRVHLHCLFQTSRGKP